ncbi:hypothetical protein [Paralysiella testudinis]|uniref:Uncharacterized protein n=1 Tax=Paralysiella testudinis TaxID=2809020 RepID=A0A892ZIK2_9NEIS|nr:hypothetical protein [Paralysiella testudinis]QRQ83415.1 hypothetical protein JQU52_13875 [Paralysiella testudinis]
MAAALHFERDTVARYWRIIDSAPGSVTVVWHRYMAAQVVGSGLDGRKPDRIAFEGAGNAEKVTEKIDNISVFGGLDGVLNGLINIQTTPPK